MQHEGRRGVRSPRWTPPSRSGWKNERKVRTVCSVAGSTLATRTKVSIHSARLRASRGFTSSGSLPLSSKFAALGQRGGEGKEWRELRSFSWRLNSVKSADNKKTYVLVEQQKSYTGAWLTLKTESRSAGRQFFEFGSVTPAWSIKSVKESQPLPGRVQQEAEKEGRGQTHP